MTTPLERGDILDEPLKADRGGGEGNGEGGGPAVVRLVVARVVVGVVGRWWWMGWVMMNCVASWGRDRRGCNGVFLGAGMDGERLLRRGVGWKTVGEGPRGLYGEGLLFC